MEKLLIISTRFTTILYYIEEEVEQAKAQERMLAGKKLDPSESFHEGRASDIIGERLGISGRSYDMGRTVMEERPEEFKKAQEGKTTSNLTKRGAKGISEWWKYFHNIGTGESGSKNERGDVVPSRKFTRGLC